MRVAEKLVAALGQDLVAIGSDLEALKALSHESFDMVLIDLDSSVSGVSPVVQSLKLLPGLKSAFYFGMTDQRTGDRDGLGSDLGLSAIVAKPLRLPSLKKLVQSCLALPEADGPRPAFDAPSTAILSEEILKGLWEIDDRQGTFVNELIDLFVELTPPLMDQLIAALGADLEAESVAFAHKLKGMCRNLGIVSLAETLDHLEMFYASLSQATKAACG